MKNSFIASLCLLITLQGTAQSKIDSTEMLWIGGIKQYISLKGADRTKPLLLFLCGGPGSSVMNMADQFTAKLQQYFVVVQWDQRQCGKTLELNKSNLPLTLSLMRADTHDLVDSLLVQFGHKKLFLMGHSWGTALGFYIADKYPDQLYAYIAISPMIDQTRSEQLTVDMLITKGNQEGNKTEVAELSQVQIPFQTWKDMYFARKWLFAFDGHPISDSDTVAVQGFIQGWASTWLSVWNEAMRENHFKDLAVVHCPIYFCAGRKDYQTNFTITQAYFEAIKSPHKELFWFDHSGHLIPNTEPDLLQEDIITRILPVATQAQ
jgi:pimeloyl-ACP methyl ester carboxylesterase